MPVKQFFGDLFGLGAGGDPAQTEMMAQMLMQQAGRMPAYTGAQGLIQGLTGGLGAALGGRAARERGRRRQEFFESLLPPQAPPPTQPPMGAQPAPYAPPTVPPALTSGIASALGGAPPPRGAPQAPPPQMPQAPPAARAAANFSQAAPSPRTSSEGQSQDAMRVFRAAMKTGDPQLQQWAMNGIMAQMTRDPSKGRFMVAGNNVFDTRSGKWMPAPRKDLQSFKPGDYVLIPDPTAEGGYRTIQFPDDQKAGTYVQTVIENPQTGEPETLFVNNRDPSNSFVMGKTGSVSRNVNLTDLTRETDKVTDRRRVLDFDKAEKTLNQIDAMTGGFSEWYLTLPGDVASGLTGAALRGGGPLAKAAIDAVDRAAGTDIMDFHLGKVGFEKSARRFVNQYIRDVTGAQMSIYEIDRIMGAIPNPFEDDPYAFMRGVEDLQAELQEITQRRLAQVRSGQLEISDQELGQIIDQDIRDRFGLEARGSISKTAARGRPASEALTEEEERKRRSGVIAEVTGASILRPGG